MNFTIFCLYHCFSMSSRQLKRYQSKVYILLHNSFDVKSETLYEATAKANSPITVAFNCDAYLATNQILYAMVQTEPIFGLLSVCHLHFFFPLASNHVPETQKNTQVSFFFFFRTALDDLDVHVFQTQSCLSVCVCVCVCVRARACMSRFFGSGNSKAEMK